MKNSSSSFFKYLFAPIIWLFQACSPIGPAVNPDLSDNHYYNKKKTDVHYVPMGNWFELGNQKMHVDVASFEVLSKVLAKDKNNIYNYSSPVELNGIDLQTCYVKDNVFMNDLLFDKDHVYFFKSSDSPEGKPVATIIEGAQPKSFESIDLSWAKDAKHHYYRNRLLDVDYQTFERINEYFSKDKEHIYHHYANTFEVTNADRETFKILDQPTQARDGSTFYVSVYLSLDEGTKLGQVPIEAGEDLEVLSEVYVKVGNKIYYNDRPLEGLDVATFELVGTYYIKDHDQAYYLDEKLEDVDATTLAVQDNGAIADKHGILVGGERREIEKDSN